MSEIVETAYDNAAWATGAPQLSVLIPFLRDDPCDLLTALDREAAGLGGAVEIVALDDGGTDDTLAERVAAVAARLATPVRFLRLSANEGRAKGRNRLARHARARHLLFLDSDMLPDSLMFLRVYLDLIAAEDPPVVFGGFTLDQTPRTARHALHRAMAVRSDCTPAERRALDPAKHVFTSNLLVRRDVFENEAFDESFSGWGWEDVEWGMRVAARYGVRHVHNTASHLGLDLAGALAAKYEQSAANFARVIARHPSVVARYPSFRAARVLKRAPLRRLWRPAMKAVALSERAPIRARMAALRLYRAALYADVV